MHFFFFCNLLLSTIYYRTTTPTIYIDVFENAPYYNYEKCFDFFLKEGTVLKARFVKPKIKFKGG